MKNCLYAAVCICCCAVHSLSAQQQKIENPLAPSEITQNTQDVVLNQTPELLSGLWEGSDRLVYLPAEKNTEISIVLKTLYGWYYDRAAEPASSADKTPRTINSVTRPENVDLGAQYTSLPVMFLSIFQSRDSGAWEMIVHYGKDEDVSIPVAVIDGKLYLDFALRTGMKGEQFTAGTLDSMNGFWQSCGKAEGIKIAPPLTAENITSYYITDSAVYFIRYWKTDMEYDSSAATFTYDNKTFSVLKHIVSAGTVYTCAMGRRLEIRNADIQKTSSPLKEYTLDSTKMICVFGKPYLVRTKGKGDAGTLMDIIAKANARRKPDPKPLFPPEDLNWHYDLIRQLEAGNPLIQAVRQRQQDFAKLLDERRRAAQAGR